MQIEIRPLTAKEKKECYERVAMLFDAMFMELKELGVKEDLEPNGRLWIEAMKLSLEKLHNILICINNDKIIGFMAGHIRLLPQYIGGLKIGYLSGLYICPEYRGNNLALQLTEEMIDWLQKKEVSYIEGDVLKHNKKSLNLFNKLGFEHHYITVSRKVQ